MERVPSRLRVVADVSPGDWVVASVGTLDDGVGGLLPRCFDAYGRILHPASSHKGRPVRWAEVAAWSGGRIHSRVQFNAIAHGGPQATRPWNEPPLVGALPTDQLSVLCEILARHTNSLDRCWFGAWDGWAAWWGEGTQVSATLPGGANHTEGRLVSPPSFAPAIRTGARMAFNGRDYFLLEGPLDAVLELGELLADSVFLAQPPNLFWPDDRAWCVATEIDHDSTYLGGSADLIDAVVADDRLEAIRASIEDPFWSDSDNVNR